MPMKRSLLCVFWLALLPLACVAGGPDARELAASPASDFMPAALRGLAQVVSSTPACNGMTVPFYVSSTDVLTLQPANIGNCEWRFITTSNYMLLFRVQATMFPTGLTLLNGNDEFSYSDVPVEVQQDCCVSIPYNSATARFWAGSSSDISVTVTSVPVYVLSNLMAGSFALMSPASRASPTMMVRESYVVTDHLGGGYYTSTTPVTWSFSYPDTDRAIVIDFTAMELPFASNCAEVGHVKLTIFDDQGDVQQDLRLCGPSLGRIATNATVVAVTFLPLTGAGSFRGFTCSVGTVAVGDDGPDDPGLPLAAWSAIIAMAAVCCCCGLAALALRRKKAMARQARMRASLLAHHHHHRGSRAEPAAAPLYGAMPWGCTACTFINLPAPPTVEDAQIVFCDMCGTPRADCANKVDISGPAAKMQRSTSRRWLLRATPDGRFLRWQRASSDSQSFDAALLKDSAAGGLVHPRPEPERRGVRGRSDSSWSVTREDALAMARQVVQQSSCGTPQAAGAAGAAGAAAAGAEAPATDTAFLSRLRADGSLEWVSASAAGLLAADATCPSGVTARAIAIASRQPFEQRVRWLRRRLQLLRVPYEAGHVVVRVTRANLLADSIRAIEPLAPIDMRRIFRFNFLGEPGVDAGGLTREWYLLTSEALFNADLGLFACSHQAGLTYSINPNSGAAHENHLQLFHFAGRLVGKALFDGQTMAAHLALPLLKQMQGVPLSLSDLKHVDGELYNNLVWLRDNTGAEALGLDFTVTEEAFGEVHSTPLKPGGEDIELTDGNKEEYVQLRLRNRLMDSVAKQLSAFLCGVYEVLPQDLLCAFDAHELELLLCGMPAIDVNDWQQHTQYSGLLSPQSVLTQWFWEAVRALSEAERARLLQFVTGTSRVPVQGFKALVSYDGRSRMFTVVGVPLAEYRYPVAHTCFNRLDLPLYASKAALEEGLRVALHPDHTTGFGLS